MWRLILSMLATLVTGGSMVPLLDDLWGPPFWDKERSDTCSLGRFLDGEGKQPSRRIHPMHDELRFSRWDFSSARAPCLKCISLRLISKLDSGHDSSHSDCRDSQTLAIPRKQRY